MNHVAQDDSLNPNSRNYTGKPNQVTPEDGLKDRYMRPQDFENWQAWRDAIINRRVK